MLRFRAWDKVAKVMIYHIEQTYDGLGNFQENENIEDYVSDISFGCFADWLENDQFVIMQSTGLFDKNGQEIFENDILKCMSFDGSLWYETVSWDSTLAGFATQQDGYDATAISYTTDSKAITVEVVGNIFEHIHLLK